ncbi:MAG: hypothetical protein GX889_12040 [Clostridiales bacterium]|nr:hypothetical protein [Clostridiales bacterium]
MKKVLYLGSNVKVLLEVKEVESISAETLKREKLKVIGINGYLLNKNGNIIKSGNIVNYLPKNEIGNNLKKIWEYNQNYTFGTVKQNKVLRENNVEVSLSDKKSFFNAVKILKEHNLLEDRGIEFGKRTLINPIPSDIINLAESLLLN